MIRLSFVQSCQCSDVCAFQVAYVQTIVRSFVFPDRVILNARHPPFAFISVWIYRLLVWQVSLGNQVISGLSGLVYSHIKMIEVSID